MDAEGNLYTIVKSIKELKKAKRRREKFIYMKGRRARRHYEKRKRISKVLDKLSYVALLILVACACLFMYNYYLTTRSGYNLMSYADVLIMLMFASSIVLCICKIFNGYTYNYDRSTGELRVVLG